MAYNIPEWSQRDPRWANTRLGGDGSTTTIGESGCAITCVSMLNAGFDPGNQLLPVQVDDLFTTHSGYANSNLLIWSKINQLLPNCALTGTVNCATTPAPVADITSHLDQGYLAILQVGFAGNVSRMHFVLAVGHNGDDIVFRDPWYGDTASFKSGRYGTGASSSDILAIHYFGDAINNESIKPVQPVAKLPAPFPAYSYDFEEKALTVELVNPADVFREADNRSEKTGTYAAGTWVDVVGFVKNGQSLDNNGQWFRDKENQYFWSGETKVVDPHAEVKVPVATEPGFAPSYYDKPEKNREVTPQGGTDVIDLTTGTVIHHLTQGEKVKDIAGYFEVNGVSYARTQYAKDTNVWNGIKSDELGAPEVEVHVTVNDKVEEILSENKAVDDFFAAAESEALSDSTRLRVLLKELLAILLSPVLKNYGKKDK